MSITKEQWDQIEKELKGMFGTVTLGLEGKELQIRRSQVAEGRWELIVYIDGSFKPAWGWSSGEAYWPFVEKIWRKRSKAHYSPKRQKEIIKIWGKRRAKKDFPNLEEKIHWYEPIFKTAKSLVSQYRKIEGLEVVCIGYKPTKEDIDALEQALSD